jgi:rhodanese-related sulfurtransferase
VSDRRPGQVFGSVDELLADARSRLRRLRPDEAEAAVAAGAMFVDIRPAWQRAVEGEIAGSLIIERNHLEWRLDPASAARVAQADGARRWIIVCSESYTSSLAADALRSVGVDATDLAGGVHAWIASGRPVIAGPSRVEAIAGQQPPVDAAELGAPGGAADGRPPLRPH